MCSYVAQLNIYTIKPHIYHPREGINNNQMRHLIIPKTGEPFLTDWFDAQNTYCEGDTVIDINNHTYTNDGIAWKPIIIDHL
jgi:hypothetical protein